MDENQTYEEKNTNYTTTNRRCLSEEHPFWKAILCALMIFLGSYCAFYTVSDWHYKRMLSSAMMPFNLKAAEHFIQKDINKMDKMFKNETGNFWGQRGGTKVIHIEQEDNAYKIMIDLRAFDNNEKNLQVSTNGNILTITGRSIRKSKNNEQISEFQQNYLFGDNVKLSDMTKQTNGNYYIITLPIVNNPEN